MTGYSASGRCTSRKTCPGTTWRSGVRWSTCLSRNTLHSDKALYSRLSCANLRCGLFECHPHPTPTLNFLWCADVTIDPSGEPLTSCSRRSHRPSLTCARALRSRTTWELHLWESIPAAAPRRSALTSSTLLTLFLSWHHLFSVTFTLVLCWMRSSSAYQVVTSSHYGWTVQSLCLKMPECPLGKPNYLHFKLYRGWVVFLLCLLHIS